MIRTLEEVHKNLKDVQNFPSEVEIRYRYTLDDIFRLIEKDLEDSIPKSQRINYFLGEMVQSNATIVAVCRNNKQKA